MEESSKENKLRFDAALILQWAPLQTSSVAYSISTSSDRDAGQTTSNLSLVSNEGFVIMANTKSPFYLSADQDTEMDLAGKLARQTFRFFWRELAWEKRRMVPALEMAAIKASFSDPPELQSDDPDRLAVEHMWVMDVEFDGRNLHGTLINQPTSLQSVQEGQQVTLRGSQLCDWMYVLSDEVYGGFTVDLMRSRMGSHERRGHDEAWGFDFGEPGLVNVVPNDYLGDSSVSATALRQDYCAAAAVEHPMSVNMRSSLEQALADDRSSLDEADEFGFNYLHQLALAGSWDGVDVCLRAGANVQQPASNGMTPYLLAKCLGWHRVMKRIEDAGGN